MSGPSIRNWELACALASQNAVTLAAPGSPRRSSATFRVCGYDAASLPELVRTHDVVQVSGYLVERHPCLASARFLVVDLYDPFPLENLHMHVERPPAEQHAIAGHDRQVLTRLVQRGDTFLCASERQRDFWTGWLAAAGRVNPYVHRDDPGLGSLLRVVPFGVAEEAAQPGQPRFRGVVQGVSEDDFLVLWGGGVWNWFDPLTLIEAAARARPELPRLRVVFPSLVSPSPEVPAMRMATEARQLSDRLALTGSTVFFGSGWVPYSERGAVLLEADVGVSLHREDVETRFSFRTRVLDYLWAGLPIVTTEGDSMADLVRTEDLGAVVAYQDAEAVAKALVVLGRDRERRQGCASRSARVADRFRWSRIVGPLLDYCARPTPAPDSGRPLPIVAWPDQRPPAPPPMLHRLRSAYREGGLAELITRGARRLRRGLSRTF